MSSMGADDMELLLHECCKKMVHKHSLKHSGYLPSRKERKVWESKLASKVLEPILNAEHCSKHLKELRAKFDDENESQVGRMLEEKTSDDFDLSRPGELLIRQRSAPLLFAFREVFTLSSFKHAVM